MNYVKQSLRRKSVLLTALAGAALAVPMMAGALEIRDLGADVNPADINNSGTIVGSHKTAAGTTVGFRLLPDPGSMIDDIIIPLPGGGTVPATGVEAVNVGGQFTGNTPTGAFLYDGSAYHVWERYGGYGINDSGQISGNLMLDNPYRASPLPRDPAIYTAPAWDNLGIATVYSRGTRDGVYADMYLVDDINVGGYGVGVHRRIGLTGSSSFLTSPAFDGVTFLPIPYGGYAKAINIWNMVVGATGTSSTNGAYAHAYLYNHNDGTVRDLGTLYDGLTSSAADINDSNQVVGTSWLETALTSLYDPKRYRAFLWDEAGGMVDLDALLRDSTGDTSWTLTSATAINDYGDIVGIGYRNGTLDDGLPHGFLLTGIATPPPPVVVTDPGTNKAPIAVASADVTNGKAALTVQFSSLGSNDPDGGIAGYSWDFGDGSALSPEPGPTHVYTNPGNYVAELTVSDDQGLTATASLGIKVRKSGGRR